MERDNVSDEIKGMNVLITGGTGFIGTHMADALLDISNVRIISNSRKHSTIETINVDIRDENKVFNALKRMDINIVFHMAANVCSTKDDAQNDFIDVNAIGTKNLLECCRKLDIDKIIFSSSMSVFGPPLYLPVDESHPKIPNTMYGLSKLAAEFYCTEYQRYYGTKLVILRYSHVFGPREPDKWIIPRFVKNAINNKTMEIWGNKENAFDFIYVKDVVQANILSAIKKEAIGEDFNLGMGKKTTLTDVARTIKKEIGGGDIIYFPEKDKVTKGFLFDIDKAQRILGYEPVFTLENGLKEQIDYMRKRM